MNKNLVVSYDVWYHVADFIEPKSVSNFALICKATYSLVRTRRFWKQLFERYCRKGQFLWVKDLPGRFQFEDINKFSLKALRRFVIEALFYCYPAFIEKCELGYSLDSLCGRIYVSSWYIKYASTWVMLTKFTNQKSLFSKPIKPLKHMKYGNETDENEVANDWEALYEEDARAKEDISLACENEGEFLLCVISDRYLPFPPALALTTKRLRLTEIREKLGKDMCSKTLVLEFASESASLSIMRYENIQKYKIIPWWTPSFKIFTK